MRCECFNSDTYIRLEIENLVTVFDIDTIIETGTFMGLTTQCLAEMVKNVLTIEVNESYYNKARANLSGLMNVTQFLGNSGDVLKSLNLKEYGSVLFYLDAHGHGRGTALKEELRAIAGRCEDPVIVIHDFQVPGKDFGYDCFDNVPLNMDFIQEDITSIYSSGYTFYYNDRADGEYRGIIYITPKK